MATRSLQGNSLFIYKTNIVLSFNFWGTKKKADEINHEKFFGCTLIFKLVATLLKARDSHLATILVNIDPKTNQTLLLKDRTS